MIFLLLYLHIQAIHGQDKLILSSASNNSCEGRVDVYHNGEWGHVGRGKWNAKNSAVVCRSLKCGTEKTTSDVYKDDHHETQKFWADDITCKGNEKHLWDCPSPTWGVVKSSPHSHVYITCTENPKPSLVLEGGTGCAGFVRLNTTNDKYYLCSDGWKKYPKHADQVCEALNCGRATEKSPVTQRFDNLGRILPYNCLREDLSLWQCLDWTSSETCSTPASVTCSNHLYFRLRGNATVNLCSGSLEVFNVTKVAWQAVSNDLRGWSPNAICAQVNCGHSLRKSNETSSMVSLHCSEKVSISLKPLKDGEGRKNQCYGVVHLNQKKSEAVCVNSKKTGRLVCQELGCGDFMFTSKKDSFQPTAWKGMSCADHAESLWHCQKDTCRDNDKTAIICSVSIDVRLSDGLDKCSGRVEILYKGAWKRVSTSGWKEDHSDIVCSHLQCGKHYKQGHDLFVDGDNELETLDLSPKATCKPSDPIHKCLEEKAGSNFQKEFMKIVCEGSQKFFVEGHSSCSGTVGVEQGGKIYSLSGERDVWNEKVAQYVCQKMQCGNMTSFNRSRNNNVTREFDCAVSGDNCKLQQARSNTTVAAEVTCSVKVTVKLTNNNQDESERRCWGEVNVCHGDRCRGVCGDVWSEEHSKMLCQNLGCGRPVTIPEDLKKRTGGKATVSSVHCPSNVTDLSHCNFVMDATCKESTAYVVCSGSLKSKLSHHRDKCGGKMEALLAGSWQPVCGDANVRNTICTETGCGTALTDTEADTVTNSNGKLIKCDTAFKSLVNCTVAKESCDKTSVRCSGWSHPLVVGGMKACSGPVFIQTAPKHLHAISSTGWGDRESRALCRSLGCGDLVEKSSKPNINFKDWWKKTYNCSDEDQNIWNCKEKNQSLPEQQLNINCKEHRNITLTGYCYGKVTIIDTRSATDQKSVCKTGWTESMSQILCRQLDCGNSVTTGYVSSLLTEAYHLSCTGAEDNLLQCTAEKGKCDSGPASVICSKSLAFNLTGQCGGGIQVLYGGELKPACLKKGKRPSHLCKQDECGNVNTSKKGVPIEGGDQIAKTAFECDLDTQDRDYCTTQSLPCESGDITELYCDGFKEITPPPELPINLIVGVTVGLLLLVIAIALVLWQRRRIMYRLRGRRAFSQTRSTLASDNFEDVELSVKEGRDMGLKSQANGQRKSLNSQASSDYDDVDEEADAGFNSADEAPPLPDRPALDGELDDVDDYIDNYDDVDQPPLEEEEDPEEPGVPAQPEDSSVPVPSDEEDYVLPDDDE